jgi:NADH:ubiquinone oxidoreductase subunit D
MRDDEKFEIIRALDLLPHITGASWAMLWFRINGVKNPTKEEFREKTVEYFNRIEPLMKSFETKKEFEDINQYIQNRFENEKKLIISGENKEVEKRHQRYLDYG